MWYCTECRREFEEPNFYLDDPSPSGIALPPGFYRYDICPYCDSEYIDEIEECEDDEE